ncbi:MAG: nitroreductase family protein [Tissierellia bacterium]|nr:nitroreductase family protein [Tissierellia bacterium]
MEVFEIIKKRRSIRKYKDEKIDKKILEKILEAGRLAPSTRNSQNWKFIMVTEKELLQKVASSMTQDFGREAQAIIVACGIKDSEYMKSNQPKTAIDISVATAYMQLVALEENIGSCWIGSFDAEIVREAIGIPSNMCAVTLTTLGYMDENPDARPRKEFDEVCKFNEY